MPTLSGMKSSFCQTQSNLRVRLRFTDGALLEISEAIVCVDRVYSGSATVITQEPPGLMLRYDNAPHHAEVSTYPDHKH